MSDRRKMFVEILYSRESLSLSGMGKSQDEINIDWYTCMGIWYWISEGIHGPDNCFPISSVYRFEGCIIHTLYANWYAIYSEWNKFLYIFFWEVFRITFEWYFSSVFLTGSVFLIKRKTCKNLSNLFLRENWRSSSSKIYTPMSIFSYIYPMRIFFRKILGDFLFEVLSVTIFFQVVEYRSQGEFTIGTLLSTKGNMDVKVRTIFWHDWENPPKGIFIVWGILRVLRIIRMLREYSRWCCRLHQ